MSSLRPGDGHLHFEDGSHRWPAATDGSHAERRREVEAHVADHQRRLGDAPARPSGRNRVRSLN